jgi:uncharacterized glyoxalase superfamily protein PhnB
MPEPTRSSVIPGMHYRDAAAAIEWLCHVFGFEKHFVAAGEGNTILHAELTLGGGMIMLGTRTGEPPFRSARDTRGISLIVADADAVYARAKENEAEIVVDIEDKPYGGRGFACRDTDGYLWHVGTYDPWQPK